MDTHHGSLLSIYLLRKADAHTTPSDEEGFHASAFCWGSASGYTYCLMVVCWE